jgi:hypothetical protein
VLNAAQQFANAIGVAALGTVFFARVGAPSTTSYFAAAELVFGICSGGYVLALLLVGLLPKNSHQTPHQPWDPTVAPELPRLPAGTPSRAPQVPGATPGQDHRYRTEKHRDE